MSSRCLGRLGPQRQGPKESRGQGWVQFVSFLVVISKIIGVDIGMWIDKYDIPEPPSIREKLIRLPFTAAGAISILGVAEYIISLPDLTISIINYWRELTAPIAIFIGDLIRNILPFSIPKILNDYIIASFLMTICMVRSILFVHLHLDQSNRESREIFSSESDRWYAPTEFDKRREFFFEVLRIIIYSIPASMICLIVGVFWPIVLSTCSFFYIIRKYTRFFTPDIPSKLFPYEYFGMYRRYRVYGKEAFREHVVKSLSFDQEWGIIQNNIDASIRKDQILFRFSAVFIESLQLCFALIAIGIAAQPFF